MQKIKKMFINVFEFSLNDNVKDFNLEGDIIPEYSKIKPFVDKSGETKIVVIIAISVEEKPKTQKCRISIFETDLFYPRSLCLENVLFYDLYTNNINGRLVLWHIFVNTSDEE